MSDPPDSKQQQSEETQNDSPAEHAELFTDSGKNEIALLHWNEFAICQRRLKVALAKPATRGHGPFGIAHLKDIASQIFVRGVLVDEGRNSLQLIAVHDSRQDCRRHSRHS